MLFNCGAFQERATVLRRYVKRHHAMILYQQVLKGMHGC